MNPHALIVITTALFAAAPAAEAAMGGGMGGYGSSGGIESTEPRAPSETIAYSRAQKLIKKGDYAGAIEKLDKLLAKAPDDADVLNLLGYSHRMLGHNDQSLDFYKRALAQNPGHRGANEYLGELYLQMNDLPSAKAQQQKFTLLCPAGCEEREDLDKAIEAYIAKNSDTKSP